MSKSRSGWFSNNTNTGKDLIKEVQNNGEKITPQKVVGIVKQPNGKIVWLEKGNDRSGLQHIIKSHNKDFNNHGIPEGQIGTFVLNAVAQNNIVGYQGSQEPKRAVYKYIYGSKIYYIAVSISPNGYIVGANPKSGGFEK